jgi:hypothetical protein
MRFVVLLRCWLALTMAACTEEAWNQTEAFTIAVPPDDNCTGPGCPTNSPVIDTYVIHDLSTRRLEANLQEIAIERFMIASGEADISVENGRIRAKRNGTVVAERQDLKGAKLWLRGPENARYVIVIADVLNVRMWAKLASNATRPPIEVYRLNWVTPTPDGEVPPPYSPLWKNICHDAMLPENSIELDLPKSRGGSTLSSAVTPPTLPTPPSETYIPNFVTFVFEGERINSATKVIYDIDTAWFNLGCAGHLLSKMHLMGHVAATIPLGYVTTVPERQTIMKMFAADYCGNGRAFTVPGIHVQWHDHRHWIPYFPSPAPVTYDVEARWQPNGAACLNVPRVDANNGVGNATRAAVAAECPMRGFPLCNQNPENFPAGIHMITVNP